MLILYRPWMIFLLVAYIRTNSTQTIYVRHLSTSININQIVYYPPLKWLYVASIGSLAIYDENLTLVQNVFIDNSYTNELDICLINPCQCLNNTTNNYETISMENYRERRSKVNLSANLFHGLPLSLLKNRIDPNNYNLALHLEIEQKIEDKPYLIDCWSLQPGSCIIRNALNLSHIYYEQIFDANKNQPQRFLFNTDSTLPNQIFPFHFKFNKCNSTPTYLFLTSTMRKIWQEKSDNLTELFYTQCLEQTQKRTIALRTLVYNRRTEQQRRSMKMATLTSSLPSTTTGVKDSIVKRQLTDIASSANSTRATPISSELKSTLTTVIVHSPSSSSSSTTPIIADGHATNTNHSTLPNVNIVLEQGPFLNINDYCPERFAVVRSIYTDFFERESSDKFRIFQDIIYDRDDAAIYVFTNQQYTSKIVRLCEGQISFRHYIELKIECGENYSLVQKVKLIRTINNKQYLLIIASKSISTTSMEPSLNSHSALCIYDLDQVRKAFIHNVLDLAKGNVSLGMAWLHGESVIPQYPTPYGNLARCSTTRDASYLMIYEGSSGLVSQPLISFPSDQLTSLEATVVNNYIVAFVGTADGKIKKISVQPNKKKAFQFEEMFVHFGESVLRHLALDHSGRFLYGATKIRLFQVDLHDCDRHKTCFSCLSTQNPYCGWATTLNRCTVRTNDTDEVRRFGWLQMRDSCPNIVEITPAAISKAKSSNLQLKVDSVPNDPTSAYSCSFGLPSLSTGEEESEEESIYVSNATIHDNHIECRSPPTDKLPSIHLDSIIVRLLYNDFILAEKTILFFDCSSYATCTSCINHSFDCIWQLLSASCTDSDLILDKNATIARSVTLNTSFIDGGCPRYNVSIGEVFIADGDQFILGRQDLVTIQTIGLNSIQQHFRCVLTFVNHTIVTVEAKIMNEWLVCDPFQISYDNDIGQQNLLFDVEWKECSNGCTYKKLETLLNFTVNIYKCKYLADSCGSCILLYDDYHCVWCETDKSCRHRINASLCERNHLISSAMGICPDPRLIQIFPQAGPQYGRTPIKVFGSSLGKNPHGISVVLIHSNSTEYPCQIQLDSYVVAQSFVCEPPALPIGLYRMKVAVHSVVSKDRPIFQIVQPTITIVYPNLGPRSGGTLLSIKGKHLTIGSQIRIFVGNQRCLIIENENIPSFVPSEDENGQFIVSSQLESKTNEDNDDHEEMIQCRTSKLETIVEQNEDDSIYVSRSQRFSKRQALWIGTISIFIDNFTATYSNITYSYTEDPQVYNLSRYSGIQSGGLSILVRGNNFDSIQLPQFFLEYNHNRTFVENCTVKSSESMLCFGPSVFWTREEMTTSTFSTTTMITPMTSIIIRTSDCIDLKFGFLMDDVERLRNTSTYRERFLLCADPDIYPFGNDGRRTQYQYDYLTIEGSNLLDIANMNDYSITIGSYPCNITSISDKQIVCQPTNRTIEKLTRRKRILLDADSKDDELTIVRVTLGRRIYTLGRLTYTSNLEKRSLILYYAIAGMSGFVLTMFIIIVSILFRQTNTKRTRQLKRLQNQIDTLEMRVARECKEAFAELQTDIGEMTNDLSQSGVPFHDYRTFCMKVLFPNATDEEKYMMLHNIEMPLELSRRTNVRQGLRLLSQSLYNRSFLLLLIRTLEMDKINFRLQDRLQFASLISVLLQDNIEYFTEILKILLRELIEKSLQQDRNNSKILLRSNASVAEKMLSNWFALLLFGYIKERIGSPLYILFQSIKQQIHRGPVDCLTNESRYSLSEDKLLRQHVEYLSMIVYVLQIEDDKSHLVSTPVPIKVLSCDSITQVKEKIVDHFYKGIPFSKRPCIDDFDLEWRVGSHMKLLRDDEKVDTSDSNGFVPMQTLATYKVHDGARLFLSLKPGTNCTNTSSFSSLISSQTITALTNGGLSGSCYPAGGSCCTKSTDADHHWQVLQGTENQTLLNGTLESISLRKEQRLTNAQKSTTGIQSERSLSLSRLESNIRFFHLVKPTDRDDGDRTVVTNKLVSEVYLTRLLATKGSLQQYIDNFFDAIFRLTDLPSPIKYLFDFLDEQAQIYQVSDTNIIHTWKSNSLPLRFFVNIIKNPDFVFDVQKTNVIDASLSVIAQMFMDSCAAGTHELTKDSPSTKLLFNRDVQKYKKLVEKYYDAIASLPAVSINELDRNMAMIKEQEQQQQHLPNKRSNEFNKTYALFKLYNEFISRYKTSLQTAMANDLHGKQYRLAALLEQIITLMETFELDV